MGGSERSGRVSWGSVQRIDTDGPGRTPDYGRIDVVRCRSYVWGPSIGEDATNFEETVLMAQIRRAWTFVMAVAPIAAIALVEAAMRRWG